MSSIVVSNSFNLQSLTEVGDSPNYQDVVNEQSVPDEEMSAEELGREMDTLVLQESVNTGQVLDKLRVKPREKSKMFIPLCRMKEVPAVRPPLSNDVNALGAHFIGVGYMEGHGVFYVALHNDHGKTLDVTDDIISSWSPEWKKKNDAFEARCVADPDWSKYSGKMFHVWDGNHRLKAWMEIINRDHDDDPDWHYDVECFVLDVPSGSTGPLVTALHQVNW